MSLCFASVVRHCCLHHLHSACRLHKPLVNRLPTPPHAPMYCLFVHLALPIGVTKHIADRLPFSTLSCFSLSFSLKTCPQHIIPHPVCLAHLCFCSHYFNFRLGHQRMALAHKAAIHDNGSQSCHAVCITDMSSRGCCRITLYRHPVRCVWHPIRFAVQHHPSVRCEASPPLFAVRHRNFVHVCTGQQCTGG